MRVLVTGASGFIGWTCVRALASLDCEVHAVYRSGLMRNQPGVVWHRADLLKSGEISRLFLETSPTHVIHAAWDVTRADYWASSENLIWAERSVELVCAAANSKVQRVIGVGTCAEYGLEHEICDERSTPLRPIGSYAQSKLATHDMFNAAGGGLGLSTAWARLFFPYGPDDKPGKLIPYAIRQLFRGEPAEFSDGLHVRDLLFASDVGGAIIALMCSNVVGPVNIASGIGLLVRDIVLRIGSMMGRPDLIRLDVREPGAMEARRWVASIDRLRQEVGWRPTATLEGGLQKTISELTRTWHGIPGP